MNIPKKNASSCDRMASGRGVRWRAAIQILRPWSALNPLPSTSVHSTARRARRVFSSEAESQNMAPR